MYVANSDVGGVRHFDRSPEIRLRSQSSQANISKTTEYKSSLCATAKRDTYGIKRDVVTSNKGHETFA